MVTKEEDGMASLSTLPSESMFSAEIVLFFFFENSVSGPRTN
jgi:hypothetical protein